MLPLAALALLAPAVLAQTFTTCNPLQQTCPANPALGKSVSVDFTSESSDFSGGSAISYGPDGAALTITQSGDSPTLISNWFIMFGRVDVTLKAAPGAGIVSSFVMQSDDLDEIDLEWLGGQPTNTASNYFGKGITGSYDRGANHPTGNVETEFNTYTVDWTSEQIVWQINGQTVRVLTAAAAGNQFPQTPMQIKIGSWAGGDSSRNAPGVVSWAGGPTDFSAGPFVMTVKSVSVQDYSTGTEYTYGDTSGSWQSIKAAGGSVGSGASSNIDTSAAPVVSATSGQPIPFSGTHAQASSSYVAPSIYPWVGTAAASAPSASCYSGRPDGWSCTANGKVVPPSSAPIKSPVTPTPSSSPASSLVVTSSGVDKSSITAAPKPITSILPYGGGVGPQIINSTTKASPSSTLVKQPSASGPASSSGPAAAPPAYTGAASAISADRVAALLGCVAGAFAFAL